MLLADSQRLSRVDLRHVLARSKWVTVAGEECSWSFTHACLTLSEARKLTRWLLKAAEAPAGTAAADRLLSFTEPNLAFSCARPGALIMVAVHFSHESAPPWAQDRQPRVVSLQLDAAEVASAAEQLIDVAERRARHPVPGNSAGPPPLDVTLTAPVADFIAAHGDRVPGQARPRAARLVHEHLEAARGAGLPPDAGLEHADKLPDLLVTHLGGW